MTISYVTKVPPSVADRLRRGVPPWGPIGYVTYKRTYARRRPDLGRTEEWHETVLRCVQALLDYGMAVTPDELSDLCDYFFLMKLMPAGRGLWQLGAKTVNRLGGASLQNCFSGDTQFFADGRPVPFEDAVGTIVRVLCPDGRTRSAEVLCFGRQPLCRVTFRPAGRSNHRVTYRVTAGHRWLLADGTQTTALKVGDRVRLTPVVPEHSDAGFVHGLIFGDGCQVKAYPDRYVIRLCGAKSCHRPLLERQAGYVSTVLTQGEPVVTIRTPSLLKRLPPDDAHEAYKASFVRGWLAADGSFRAGDTDLFRLHTVSAEAADWAARHAGLLGYVVTGRQVNDRPTNFGPRTRPLHELTLRFGPCDYVVADFEETGESGAVYCVSEPETRSFVLAGGVPTGNCWFVPVNSLDSFCFLFDQLMLGGGVGFSVLGSDVYKLPKVRGGVDIRRVDRADVDYIVPDNREGWVRLLREVLTSFFETGRSFTYSCQCVRSKGAPITGFGGTASGPDELSQGLANLSAVLRKRAGRHLRPVDALDVCNIIGAVVVAGNVRRSAQIALGHAEDADFLAAKRWDLGGVPNWRAMSNNTVVVRDTPSLPGAFWDGYLGNGEPYGLFNPDLCRQVGRLADGDLYPDPDVEGVNPCGEQPLAPWECCCLTELPLPMLADVGEFHHAAELVHKVAKTMISLPQHWPRTQAVVEKNRRVGNGVTGVLQSSFTAADYDSVYKHLREVDLAYSRLKGMAPSVKLTTVKPSGTLSLLPGVVPGVHPAYAPYYVRRVRMASDDPLVSSCRQHGYHVEPVLNFDRTQDASTSVVSFPVRTPPGTPLARDLSAVDQLDNLKHMQTVWSDNAVSVTVYYRKEELAGIKAWLADNYRTSVKSVSFLLHSDHGFTQAPYEEITAARYDELSCRCHPVVSLDDHEERELVDADCVTGHCPVR